MTLPAQARSPRPPRGQRPNILFIVTDQQQSFADLPSELPLPAQERLLARGTGFLNHHVNTTPCGPSRSVIYTGRHTQQTGVFFNPNMAPHPELARTVPTIGHRLRQYGYHTAYKGKWHLSLLGDHSERALVQASRSDALEPYGFSDFNVEGDHSGHGWSGYRQDRATAADACSLLDRLKARAEEGQPWFLAVNFVNPHDIMFFDATGEQERTRLMPGLIAPLLPAPSDPFFRKTWDFDLPRSLLEDDLSTKPWAQRDEVERNDYIYGLLPREDHRAWRAFRDYYFNCIRHMDQQLGLLLDGLSATGQEEDTIVVFTSDHGERAGAHGLRQKGLSIYKENLRVPLIIAHPDVPGGRMTEALSSAVDLVPTLLGLAGVDAAERADRHADLVGHDLSAAATSPGARTDRDAAGILFNYEVAGGWDTGDLKRRLSAVRSPPAAPLPPPSLDHRALFRGVHDGRYKFARYFAPSQHHTPGTWAQLTAHNDLELYDTRSDPDELVNLAARPESHRDLILALNARTNRLVAAEVGVDDGASLPGPTERYNQLVLS